MALILGLYGDENQADIGEPNIGEPQPQKTFPKHCSGSPPFPLTRLEGVFERRNGGGHFVGSPAGRNPPPDAIRNHNQSS
jgi:hypothetical protein